LNTRGDFFYPDAHLKIDNTNLSADEAAEQAIEHFRLRCSAGCPEIDTMRFTHASMAEGVVFAAPGPGHPFTEL
jgi:hypothetical protein